MSLSWRINVTLNNRSQRTLASPSSGTGATVIRALRSFDEPKLFGAGESDLILATFGAPSQSNPELLEALAYNEGYPIYLCSPCSNGVHGGVLITTSGTKSLFDGVSYATGKPDSTLTAVVFGAQLTLTSSTTTSYTYSGGLMQGSSDSGYVAYTDISSHISGFGSREASTSDKFFLLWPGLDSPLYLSSMYDSDAGTVAFTSSDTSKATITGNISTTDGTISSTGLVISNVATGTSGIATPTGTILLCYTVNIGAMDDVYGMLCAKGASTDTYIKGRLTKNVYKASEGYKSPYESFTLAYQCANQKGVFSTDEQSPVEFGNTVDAVNAYNETLNPEKVFEDNDMIDAYINTENGLSIEDFTPNGTDSTSDASYVLFAGGYHDLSDADIAAGWDALEDNDSYQFDLAFDATCLTAGISGASTIRTGGSHPYTRILLPIVDPNASNKTMGQSITESEILAKKTGYSIDRGISLYFGYFKMSNNYANTGDVIWIPMGEIARRHADAIYYSYGGLATAWIDENGVGGQLTDGRILQAKYRMSESLLEALDEDRINPVVYDHTYGPMIVSRRTTILDDSDYSFNDYSGTFDYILKRVVENVLPYQLVKFNDADHRRVVKTKIESILQPLTVAPYNVLNAYLVKCDAENNDETVLDKQEFHVDVAVQVTAKSRWVYFTFTNTSQTVSVEEALA